MRGRQLRDGRGRMALSPRFQRAGHAGGGEALRSAARWQGAQAAGDRSAAAAEQRLRRTTKRRSRRQLHFTLTPCCCLACASALSFCTMARSRSPSVFALQPVVDGGQGDVGLGERGRLLDDRFELAARGIQLVLAQGDGGELVARAEVAGPDLERASQTCRAPRRDLVVVLQQNGELQVGGEIVGIGGEGFAKGVGRGGGIAGAQQGLAVVSSRHPAGSD